MPQARNWDAGGQLPVVPLDGKSWTVAETAKILGLSDMQARKLRKEIPYSHLFAVGKRRSTVQVYSEIGDKRGRFAKVYKAEELIELVELLGLYGPRYVEPSSSVERSERPRRRTAKS